MCDSIECASAARSSSPEECLRTTAFIAERYRSSCDAGKDSFSFRVERTSVSIESSTGTPLAASKKSSELSSSASSLP
eukprot:4407462-Prymnesium_polylepis.2